MKKDPQIEKILKPYNEDVKRHMTALSEDFQGRVKVVAEQFGSLNKKIDKMQTTLESHTEMIGELLIDVTTVKEDVKSIKESLKTKVNHKEFVELKRQVLAE
ncbi:MAG: hypothetical protein UX89_C0022G0003 [Parcubacteria group bacterium GW2011_GWA2_47_16]|nr:MAG: hypothetical protein UX89_C0022G0003 [Parcubacteria group bacterium GW2011_GWA2_47_16]